MIFLSGNYMNLIFQVDHKKNGLRQTNKLEFENVMGFLFIPHSLETGNGSHCKRWRLVGTELDQHYLSSCGPCLHLERHLERSTLQALSWF